MSRNNKLLPLTLNPSPAGRGTCVDTYARWGGVTCYEENQT